MSVMQLIRVVLPLARSFSATPASQMAAPLQLTYFNFGGRAEPIRFAFAIGEIAFEVSLNHNESGQLFT